MVKRQSVDLYPEAQRLAKFNVRSQDENKLLNNSSPILAEQKVKSRSKSPLRKRNTNINVVTFNPASKTGKLSFLKKSKSKTSQVQADEKIVQNATGRQDIKNVNNGFETDDTLPGPSSDEQDHSLIESKENILDERVEEEDDLHPKILCVPEEPHELEKELDWIEQDAKRFQKALNKHCNNCSTKMARWYCHGCNFSFCISCHQNIHKHFVKLGATLHFLLHDGHYTSVSSV